jgi:chromosome segregation ATPase
VSGSRIDAAAAPRTRPTAAVARASWLATHGPSLVVVWALLAVALLSGASAEDQAADGLSALLEHGGVGAVVGAVLTWASTYRARQSQAARLEARADEAAARASREAARAHEEAYSALGSAMTGLRAELTQIRDALDAARTEAETARTDAEQTRTELHRAEAEIARLRDRLRATTDAVLTLDVRTRASVTPAEGHRIDLESSDPRTPR